LTSPILMDKN